MEAHAWSGRWQTKYKMKPSGNTQHINCLTVIFWMLLSRYGIHTELDNVFPGILNINNEIDFSPAL